MIVVKVRGGLGNQFFQYACGRRLALLHGSRVKIDPSLWMAEPRHHDRPLRLWDFMVDAEMATADELASVNTRLVREEVIGFHPSVLRLPDNVTLEGYWQSEAYFADAAVMIRRDFRFADDTMPTRARASINRLRDQGNGTVVAVHVRRGDYAVPDNAGLFHLLSANWYNTAMERFPADTRFLVFSDDLPWCQANLTRPGLAYARSGSDLGDFALMRACDHYIMANSSFSWWAAYLSDSENPQVVAPTADAWFGARLIGYDAGPIIPDRWIRQPDPKPSAPQSPPVAAPPPTIETVEANLTRILLKGGGTALRLRSDARPSAPQALPPAPAAEGGEAATTGAMAGGVTWAEGAPGTVVDAWRRATGTRHLTMLSADRTAWAATALDGAAQTLGHGRVDYVILHGPAPTGADFPAAAIVDQFLRCGYLLFGLSGSQLHGTPDPEALLRSDTPMLVMQQRLQPLIGASPVRELDLSVLCWDAGIKPRGIIHVGAHEGQELDAYRRMGLESILFVEANPVLYEKLAHRLAGEPGVRVVHRAITDQDGPVTLRVASFDQSSSVLPLAEHQTVYPGIVEVGQVTVRGSTLDTLAAELGLDPAAHNLLHLDIQGAEGLALKGAARLLSSIEGVRVELNFAELYAGCAQIEEIDDRLAAAGLQRRATLSGYHASWGDGFYARPHPTTP